MVFQVYAAVRRRRIAIAAGISFCMIAFFAMLSYIFFFSKFYIPGNAPATANMIRQSPWLLRGCIFFFLAALVFDLLVSWFIYQYFEKVHQPIVALCTWSRLLYTALFGTSFLPLLMAMNAAANTETDAATITLYLNSFDSMWSMSLIIFGLHLLTLGYLTLKSREVPLLWVALTIIAGCLYIGHHSMNLISANYGLIKSRVEEFLSLPMALGELGLAGWLITKGGK